jgi:hypothetical protein
LRCTFDQSQLSTIGAITLTLPVKTKEWALLQLFHKCCHR